MKKTFIGIVAAIMLSSGVANAADEERFTFGLEVAPSVSWLTNGGHKNVESDGAKFKFAGGLVAYYNFGVDNKYAVFSGINYNGYGGQMKGDILSNNGKIGTTQVEYDFQELEIPWVCDSEQGQSVRSDSQRMPIWDWESSRRVMLRVIR